MYESEHIARTLQKLTVKITTSFNLEGSGILYISQVKGDRAFIITAKHCLKGKNLDFSPEPSDLTIRLYNQFEYRPSLEDQIFYHPNKDIAIITVSKPFLENLISDISNLSIVVDNGGELSTAFYGFPKGAPDTSAVRVNAAILPPIEDNTIWLESSLESEENITAYTVEGFSGSGLGLLCSNQVYLFGIVTNFGEWKRFKSVSILYLNEILKDNGQPPEPVTVIETNPELIMGCKVLNNNTANLLDHIDEEIGSMHLERADLLKSAQDLLASNNAIMIHGSAGAGKSTLTKELLDIEAKQNGAKVISFNGAQICKDNITETLASLNISQSFDKLLESKEWMGKKIVYIDSAEKAIENNQIAVLKDLLLLPSKHTELKVVLSVRSYALTQTAFNLINDSKIQYVKMEVDLLTDKEMAPLIDKYPKIGTLLKNRKIESFIRTPFYLKQIIFILEDINPATDGESELKIKLWQKIVKKDKIARELAFQKVAIDRAIQLRPYVTLAKGVDGDVIKELLFDNILIEHTDEFGNQEYAPSHDVFEDWALVKHISENYKNSADLISFTQGIGEAYAIKRGFRFWLQELYRVNPPKAKQISQEFIKSATFESWRNEAITALLNSTSCTDFLNDNAELLLQDNATLLLRHIHLLRTTCKVTGNQAVDPNTGDDKVYLTSNILLPIGPGWLSLIGFINSNFERLTNHHIIISLILFDWQNGIDNGMAAPEIQVIELVLKLLNTYREAMRGTGRSVTDGLTENLIKLLFQLPQAAPSPIENFLEEAFAFLKNGGSSTQETQNNHLKIFYKKVVEIALSWKYSSQLCKHFPDLICEIAQYSWILPEETEIYQKGPGKSLRSIYHTLPDDYGRVKPEQLFGLQSEYRRNFNPASAFQTPAPHLLRYHPDKGLSFILELLNNATAKFAQHATMKTEVKMVSVTLGSDVVSKIGHPFLWLMYRGGSHTPPLLQSLLMALENYLLDLGDTNTTESKNQLCAIIDQLLSRSNNVSTIAIIASIAPAYPFIVGERMLFLFKSKEMIIWDLERTVNERHFLMDISFSDKPRWLWKERSNSQNLPHRKQRLEDLLLKMSLYEGYFEKIMPVLNEYKEELEINPTPEHPWWPFILKRMDRRNYIFKPYDDQNSVGFIMQPDEKIWPTDQAQLSDGSAINVWSWCDKILEKHNEEDNSIERWRHFYDLCKELMEQNTTDNTLYNSPASLATIGLRYHSTVLTDKERTWCINTLVEVGEYFVEQENSIVDLSTLGKYSVMNKDAALTSLPLLFSYGIDENIKQRVERLVVAHLHNMPIDDGLNKPLFEKISKVLWQHNSSLTLNCFRSFLLLGMTQFENRHSIECSIERIMVRKAEPANSYAFQTHYMNRLFLDKAYLMISECPVMDEEASVFVESYLNFLLSETFQTKSSNYSWKARHNEYYSGDWHFQGRFGHIVLNQPDSVAKKIFSQLLGYFLVDAKTSIDHLTEDSISFAQKCLEQVIRTQDRHPQSGRFNELWNILAKETIKTLRPVFLNQLLLNIGWKDDASTWTAVEADVNLYKTVIKLFGAFDPINSIKLVSGIGFDSLFPESIELISQISQSKIVKAAGNLAWLGSYEAEKFIQRAFFLHGNQVRADEHLRVNFVHILDAMIEQGSSIAYLIKENISSVNIS